jgi:carboxymethylenebutenolidase
MKKVAIVSVLLVIGFLTINALMRQNTSEVDKQMKNTDPHITNSLTITGGAYEVISQDVSYFPDTNGFLATPKEEGQYPGIIMIHEWWGLNDSIKVMAQKLASDGYNVLAVDLYRGKVASTPEQARALAEEIDQEDALLNMRLAAAFLRERGSLKIASLGWCFGGGQSLALSLSGEPLDGTVIYYGDLETDSEKLQAIEWPVLGIFGDKDQSIPAATVTAFEDALNQLGVENEVYVYPNVGHAFANPTGDNYAPDETKDAWNKTVQFLNRTLKTQST